MRKLVMAAVVFGAALASATSQATVVDEIAIHRNNNNPFYELWFDNWSGYCYQMAGDAFSNWFITADLAAIENINVAYVGVGNGAVCESIYVIRNR